MRIHVDISAIFPKSVKFPALIPPFSVELCFISLFLHINFEFVAGRLLKVIAAKKYTCLRNLLKIKTQKAKSTVFILLSAAGVYHIFSIFHAAFIQGVYYSRAAFFFCGQNRMS